MEWIIWSGAAMSLIGLVGILYSISAALRARKNHGETEELRAALAALLPINLGALMLSILGLGVVVAGIFLSA